MFDTVLEKTIIGTAIALRFAHGWYLNMKMQTVYKNLDDVMEQFNGLREYLYEIDPQFDDERHLLGELDESIAKSTISFAGINHMELEQRKEEQGKRTLNTPFVVSP